MYRIDRGLIIRIRQAHSMGLGLPCRTVPVDC
jgi:hypothetical protein